MSESPTYTPTDADGCLATDVPCVACGYNLRGLPPDGGCPECNAAISGSLFEDRLALADPAWLRRMARGFDFVLGGFAFGIVMFVLLVIVEEMVRSLVKSEPVASAIAWLMGMPPGLVIAFGCWLLTSPEPGKVNEGDFSPRRIARTGAMATVLMAAITGPAAVASDTAASLTFGLGCIALTVAGFAALVYGRVLALRMPNKSLAKQVQMLRIAYTVLTILFFGGLALSMVFTAFVSASFSGSDFPDSVFTLIAVSLGLSFCLGVLLALACAVHTLTLMIRFRNIFHAIVRSLETA